MKAKRPQPTLEALLRQVLGERPESWRAVARGAGVPLPSVTRFVNGERTLSLPTADKLCAYLGIRFVAPEAPPKTETPPDARLGAAVRRAAEIARKRPRRRKAKGDTRR